MLVKIRLSKERISPARKERPPSRLRTHRRQEVRQDFQFYLQLGARAVRFLREKIVIRGEFIHGYGRFGCTFV
jgi:hypothetical protein